MKKKIIHAGCVASLSVCLLFSFMNASALQEENGGKKSPKQTLCCKDGVVVGYANKCIDGTGDCTDNRCLGTFVWESESGTCNYSF